MGEHTELNMDRMGQEIEQDRTLNRTRDRLLYKTEKGRR
jgi:hypothetical protein